MMGYGNRYAALKKQQFDARESTNRAQAGREAADLACQRAGEEADERYGEISAENLGNVAERQGFYFRRVEELKEELAETWVAGRTEELDGMTPRQRHESKPTPPKGWEGA